jgi:hypothetical protein
MDRRGRRQRSDAGCRSGLAIRERADNVHALWYALPVTVVGLVVLFMVVGLRYLYKEKNPPLWLQFACIVPLMIFSLRYWYLPIEIAAGMFSGIYDPFHNTFPGMAAKDMIPCTNNEYPCSV